MFNTRECCQPAGRTGLDDVKAQVGGAAAHAKGFIVPLALDAKDRLIPLALDAKDHIVPLAEAAAGRARPFAEAAVEFARPVVEQARLKMVDVVDTDVKPRLAELRLQATPVLTEVAGRVHRAPVAVKVEPPAPVVTPKRRHPVLKWLGLAVLAAVVYLVVKTLLGSRDDGWELQEDDLDEDTDKIDVPADAEAAPEAPVEYGEGSYRGTEPPEGFVIKGNERSMKYHVPTAIGFERLVTDLWFDSPEAAERAGFTRALR